MISIISFKWQGLTQFKVRIFNNGLHDISEGIISKGSIRSYNPHVTSLKKIDPPRIAMAVF